MCIDLIKYCDPHPIPCSRNHIACGGRIIYARRELLYRSDEKCPALPSSECIRENTINDI